MAEQDSSRFFGDTARVFVLERTEDGQVQYLVRPGIVIVDGNQILFRNLASRPVTVMAEFLAMRSVSLAPRGAQGDRAVVALGEVEARFYEYSVEVDTGASKRAQAIGASRPGAIIDR